MYSSIRINGYRGVDSFRMEGLGRVNLLVGKNNSGKTSILECIELLQSAALEALGVMVYANGDAAARWDGVKTWCGSEFPDLPDQIPAEGL